MLRSHTCGELRQSDAGKSVTLCGWVQAVRDKGSLLWIDLRDRYGITQITIETEKTDAEVVETARTIGREFVISVSGVVAERYSKTDKIATGEIEVYPQKIILLNKASTPPFTIEENTDGGDELRMKYRYLDLRRESVRKNLELRHRLAIETRNYLDGQQFLEVETPVLIKSTPEGARDFVVPSRMHPGQYYALPQSPQTFKQLLMVSGFDRYYQIVKCFRDEDLRADRQPEFTQIDCEMSFVEREDILDTFEGLVRHLFQRVKGISIPPVPRMSYKDAMRYYGNDKPDTRFDMRIVELKSAQTTALFTGGFKVFDDAQLVAGICVKGCASYTRKQLDDITAFVKRPQIGAGGLIYVRCNDDESVKSSVDKFFKEEELKEWMKHFQAEKGDLVLILAGAEEKTRKALSELRLEMGSQLGLRDKNKFSCLWVIDFPLLEWNEGDPNLPESMRGRWVAKHHPFTAPSKEDAYLIRQMAAEACGEIVADKEVGSELRIPNANAYDMVINGVEVGGGSIRIHDKNMQSDLFSVLGFSKEEAEKQFGFLLNAFEYGAPPHGGIAFGFDRLCSLFGGADSIRDFIAFPKNNAGRDVMIDSPSEISDEQKGELSIRNVIPAEKK